MVLSAPSAAHLSEVLKPEYDTWAIDLETRGLDPYHSDSYIVGIGFANQDVTLYVDLRAITDDGVLFLEDYIRTRAKLTAFNVKFDASFLYPIFGWLNWDMDTYGMYKQLSNEGYENQSWSLETAQLNYLGWPETNKTEMEMELIERGLTKADMWQLPAEVLGKYCALDAAAHWQLYEELQADLAAMPFAEPTLKFHCGEYLTMVKLLVEQQSRGILINKPGLARHYNHLIIKADEYANKFLSHPNVAPYIQNYNEEQINLHKAKEPPKTIKSGEPSTRWDNWANKHKEVKATQHFNLNSKKQLGWLFYECLYKVIKSTRDMTHLDVDGRVYEIEKTDGGANSVSKKVLALFGEPGMLLLEYNKLLKEQGYVEAARELTRDSDVIRPDYNSFGTVTGRLSGGSDDGD